MGTGKASELQAGPGPIDSLQNGLLASFSSFTSLGIRAHRRLYPGKLAADYQIPLWWTRVLVVLAGRSYPFPFPSPGTNDSKDHREYPIPETLGTAGGALSPYGNLRSQLVEFQTFACQPASQLFQPKGCIRTTLFGPTLVVRLGGGG